MDLDDTTDKFEKEKFTRSKRDDRTNTNAVETDDIDYVYDDTDKYHVEIAELYSYTEESEFKENYDCFVEFLSSTVYKNKLWMDLSCEDRTQCVQLMVNRFDHSDDNLRMSAVRSILYLLQGVFGECDNIETQILNTRENVSFLYHCEVFTASVQLLHLESANLEVTKRRANSISDNREIRAIINILYIMLETIRTHFDDESEDEISIREDLKMNILYSMDNYDETFIITLFSMINQFCNGTVPHFPIKKVLLLLWKSLLLVLGSLDEIHDAKNEIRKQFGLNPLDENTHEICTNMRASSPPMTVLELNAVGTKSKNINKKILKQGALEDENSIDFSDVIENDEPKIPVQGLPWKPKSRERDINDYFNHLTKKFVGFSLSPPPIVNQMNSNHPHVALPQPLHEVMDILYSHVYISVAEMQINKEELIFTNPLSQAETNIPETPAEIIYKETLPNMPQYLIALLKILLAAAPTSKAKSDPINILADVFPEHIPGTVMPAMSLGIDVSRHKEIIVKSISALLLLLLKKFKLNHIFQFEFMSQHLVFANCIPLVLKFFNQNISSYVTSKNDVHLFNFPRCIFQIKDFHEKMLEDVDSTDTYEYTKRNMFSCINLLRILNKLTKWKHSRTMMLVVFKSAPILRRALKVRNGMLQMYVLKLIKMQTKYLGRQWRKVNMKIMTAIYQKVRHRFTDDWAYGNDMDARPWDFQAEESALRSSADRFNNRRYNKEDSEFEPVDNCLQSILSSIDDFECDQIFHGDCAKWVDLEVLRDPIKWEILLKNY